jgi:hypothetical protein
MNCGRVLVWSGLRRGRPCIPLAFGRGPGPSLGTPFLVLERGPCPWLLRQGSSLEALLYVIGAAFAATTLPLKFLCTKAPRAARCWHALGLLMQIPRPCVSPPTWCLLRVLVCVPQMVPAGPRARTALRGDGGGADGYAARRLPRHVAPGLLPGVAPPPRPAVVDGGERKHLAVLHCFFGLFVGGERKHMAVRAACCTSQPGFEARFLGVHARMLPYTLNPKPWACTRACGRPPGPPARAGL